MPNRLGSVMAVAVCAGLATVVFSAMVFAAEMGKRSPSAGQSLEIAVLPFVKQYCLECHQGEKPTRSPSGQIPLRASIVDDRATWRKVSGMLRSRKMPPEETTAQRTPNTERSLPASTRPWPRPSELVRSIRGGLPSGAESCRNTRIRSATC